MSVSDSASLFEQAPGGPGQDVKYWSGTIITWNPDTFENVVEVGGAMMINLSVLGAAEAESFAAGSVVGIVSIRSKGGASTWAILGRIVKPDTPDVDEATGLLSRRTVADSIVTQQGTSTTTFVDLATVGPSVTVHVRPSGRLVVAFGCQIQSTSDNQYGGVMTVEFSGANVITAATVEATQQVRRWQSVSGGTFTDQTFVYSAAEWEGLNTGDTTITAKYRSIEGAGSAAIDFGRRSLVVTVL